MALQPGSQIGAYEVTAFIGEGGMGQVFRARDTKLNREVALKVLPDSFANDAERLARFTREAQTLASLNHPNIAHIHGLEESGGVRALVMELVEGEDLSQRIARGPIPVDEALPIAKQIAEALEAAHEQAIIHRDLKPANIKVRPDGTVKVLDFGLAKALEPVSGSVDVTASPTITSPAMMTGVGVLLGTAAYMSPEQARGKALDRRTDIWAFGCVLYEMLTGKRPFDGEDITDVLGAVVRLEPDWTALPATIPPAIRALLRRCLEKDRGKRIGDIAVARFAIEEMNALGTADDAAVRLRIDAAGARVRRRLMLGGAVALLVGGSTAVGTVWLAMRPTPPRVVQLAIPTTPATAPTINGNERNIAITPDGSRIIYAGNNGTTLFVRSLDSLEPVSLYTGVPRAPFVSPDGQWVGFTDTATTLKKVAITGGPAVTLATLDGASRGATWLPDDTIVFATISGTGLNQVAAAGGPVTALTHPDRGGGEVDHVWPEVLPGGRAVLFTIIATSGGLDAAQIAVIDLQTHTETIVVRGGSHAHYVASGHLVYTAGGALRAIAFDPVTRRTRGTPVSAVPEVVTTIASPGGGVEAAMASDGTLAYFRGSAAGATQRLLAWVDRQGREVAIDAPPRVYIYPRISPEGDRVVVYASDQESDLWLWNVTRLTLTRLTFTPGLDTFPVWTADGQRLVVSSQRDGQRNLYVQSVDGTAAAERLTNSPNIQNATGATPDGNQLLFTEISQTGEDVMQVTLAGSHTVTPLVQTSGVERNGTVSSDGRWLAYEANDSGSFEIYVRPYPDVTNGRWQVSTSGGTRPLWSRDGRELFYVSPANALMRVGVERAASWTATTPEMLLKDGSVISPGGNLGRTYDISADGQRVLIIKPVNVANAPPPQLIIVQHFDEMLKRLVPVN